MSHRPAVTYRTDMAVEAHDLVRDLDHAVPGVTVREEQRGEVQVTRVRVESEEAAERMGKPPGTYVTLDAPRFRERDPAVRQAVAAALTDELARLVGPPSDPVLVIGLGNRHATPDALGPRVVERIWVTRHLERFVRPEVRSRVRPVAALAPGVLGTTGIETVEVVRAAAAAIRPARLVAVDALAARAIGRLVASVQIADSGIHPGSGVGNHRHGLTAAALGIPVIAVGVPTVVGVTGIVVEALEALIGPFRRQAPAFGVLARMSTRERRDLVEDLVGPRTRDLFVTPKEVDTLVDDMAAVVAEALNRALQPEWEPVGL